MNFTYLKFLPLLLISFLVLAFFLIRQETKTFLWIEKYWFYKRTVLNKVAFSLFILSLFFFLFSLLDLRGPSISRKTNIPDQKTIIIIDSSASMLVEDVRPNRFLKSLLMARHFVKKAYGHQIAVVLFSDVQKRIIPFTDDIELLDSRIEGLERQNITRGGSNIGQAIAESIQYFKAAAGSREAPTGNLLLFTDSDETREDFNVEVPDGITLSVVAVATRSGGPIPMKDQRGNFFGYKKFQGKQVISKLDDTFLKELGSKVKNYKYWEITTYNLPTDEILNFFNNIFQSKISEKDIDIRPVYTQYLVIVAIVLYILSVLLSRGKNLTLTMLFLLALPSTETWGADKKTEDLMDHLRKGKLQTDGVLKLAEKLLQENKPQEAAQLYNEIEGPDSIETSINHGTALVLSGNIEKGLSKYEELTKRINSMAEPQKSVYLNSLRNNILMALKEEEKQKQKEKQQQQDKENKQNQKGDEGQEGKNQEGSQKDKSKDDQKDGEDKEKNQKDDEKNKGKKDKEEKGKDKEKDEKPQDPLKEKEDKIKKSREKMKVPAKIKQILDDDRKLQQEYLDTSTQGKRQDREVKDW